MASGAELVSYSWNFFVFKESFCYDLLFRFFSCRFRSPYLFPPGLLPPTSHKVCARWKEAVKVEWVARKANERFIESTFIVFLATIHFTFSVVPPVGWLPLRLGKTLGDIVEAIPTFNHIVVRVGGGDPGSRTTLLMSV